ncbi:unknown protein [Desulfotalea psychrophila LSv54]|uniref:Peptidase A2 domain-containing protein n=2 Tax=Desulfotalea psychrophila TaxID=84980 RepID=Q6ANE6_DESPS|nr:unknown protein [Desulfotalea psychrophila LSv54]
MKMRFLSLFVLLFFLAVPGANGKNIGSSVNRAKKNITKITIINNQILIPVTLRHRGRSKRVYMVLDTGSSHTTIPYRYLKGMRANYGPKVVATVANGSKCYGRSVELDMLRVSTEHEYNFTVSTYPQSGSQNRGLLGVDFLKKHPFKIDFENKYIVWM